MIAKQFGIANVAAYGIHASVPTARHQAEHIVFTLRVVDGTPSGPSAESCDCAEVDGQLWHREPEESLIDFETRVRDDLNPDKPFTWIKLFQEERDDIASHPAVTRNAFPTNYVRVESGRRGAGWPPLAPPTTAEVLAPRHSIRAVSGGYVRYVRQWEPLATCLQRVADLGLAAEEAKLVICDLILARRIGLRLILAADQKRLLTETVVQQDRIEPPARLRPTDFDWKNSRPSRALLKRWSFIPPRAPAEPVTLYIARCGDLIERDIECIELSAPELIDIISTEASTTSKNKSEAAKSGAPGRPTSKHLVIQEFRRRQDADKVEKTLSQEAEALSDWLKTEHPSNPQMASRTVENAIRAEYRKKCGNARNQK